MCDGNVHSTSGGHKLSGNTHNDLSLLGQRSQVIWLRGLRLPTCTLGVEDHVLAGGTEPQGSPCGVWGSVVHVLSTLMC